MSQTSKSIVRFIRVNTNSEKQHALCHLVVDHCSKKEKVLILVPSNEAATYIDQLLWKQPEESFIPHAICQGPANEPVAITTASANVNRASFVVNLTSLPLEDLPNVKFIYELNDGTSPEREALSRKKLQAYSEGGFQIEER